MSRGKKKTRTGLYHWLVMGKNGGALCGPRAVGTLITDPKAITCKRCIHQRKLHPFK